MKKKDDSLVKTFQYILFVCVIIFGFITIVGTGGGGSDTTPIDQKADLIAELDSYPTWKEFADVKDAYDEPVDITTAYVSNEVLCTTTPYSLTQNPEEIVTFGTAPDVLWLGSLIQGDSYLGGLGSLEELPIRQRAPLTIAIKVLTGTDITREVEAPTSASVQQALSEIVAEAEDSGYETGGSAYYLYKESYSSEQMALSLGVSYRCMGTSAKATMAYETSEEKNTITAYFKQVMFEAYIVRPQTPAEFFSADFTQERLDEQIDLGNIGTDNLPVYVSRIQYGRILMYSMTSTASMEDLELAAKYGYDGWADVDAVMQTKLQNIIKDSEIKVVAIGGGDKILRECLKDGNIAGYFKSDVSLTSAEPIAYAVVNLADGSLAMVSETTEYDVHQCGGGDPVLYDDWQLWKDAVNALNLQSVEWPTTPGNIASSNEFTVPPVPNQGMGNILTWESSKTGFPFTFHLYGPESGENGLVYEDSFDVIVDQERSISIGDTRPDWDRDNDDFEVKITKWDSNCRVFAIGITVGHNGKEDEEFIEVTGVNGLYEIFAKDPNDPLAKYAPDCRFNLGFIGIVSKVPLITVFFDEHHTTDNIFVRDPCFGYLEWTD